MIYVYDSKIIQSSGNIVLNTTTVTEAEVAGGWLLAGAGAGAGLLMGVVSGVAVTVTVGVAVAVAVTVVVAMAVPTCI